MTRVGARGPQERRRLVRFLLLAIAPVPSAVVLLVVVTRIWREKPDMVLILNVRLVIGGFVWMGLPSLFCALVVAGLDRCTRWVRTGIGRMLGAASGGFPALATGDAVRFVLLGALVGILVTVFADWIAPPMLATGT